MAGKLNSGSIDFYLEQIERANRGQRERDCNDSIVVNNLYPFYIVDKYPIRTNNNTNTSKIWAICHNK